MRRQSRQGFTLIEMSIVLVIIGLLVGGVLGGRAMMRQAQLQAVISSLNKYQTALNQFKQKYKGLPGDMTDATDYWPATANGDGDGKIGNTSSATSNSAWVSPAEPWYGWQQLALGGFIAGTFTGTPGIGTQPYLAAPGINEPAAGISGSGYELYSGGPFSTTDSAFFAMTGASTLVVMGGPNGNNLMPTPVLTARETSDIDVKLDDGTPSLGTMRAFKSWTPNCTTTPNGGTPVYNLTNRSVACSFMYILDTRLE